MRIKEEQDFVDNYLIKYIEILNELELVEEDLYNSIKYGCKEKKNICLLKNGLSLELTNCLVQSKYDNYIRLDLRNNDIVSIDKRILEKMEDEQENSLLMFELAFHIH